MENFQLYRTNLYLGGQMKWDIIIDSVNNTLYVNDFHLSPISRNITYTHKSDEQLLNNTHQDNVKRYYNELRSNFYNEGLNPEFNHNWPIILKEDKLTDYYSNTYDMGCRRMKSYQLYKKQFEFFCPVWLEQLNDNIKFKISVKDVDSNKVLSSNALILKLNGIHNHDKFVKYFNNYIHDTGIDCGCNDLLNINFKKNSSLATGLNASTGVFVTKEIDSLVQNLTLRERPLMDADNLLINSFSHNSIIAKQLYNFNICFNIEDILSGSIAQLMLGREISVSVDVYIGDKLLEKKDFNTEYEYINKVVDSNNTNNSIEKLNVLDYFHDYEALDLINKNKLSQHICHWSLCDSNDYIFNVYNGFSGLFTERLLDEDGNEIIVYHENEHQHENASNTFTKTSDKSHNSTGWINTKTILYWNEFYRYLTNTDEMKLNGIHIDSNKNYINNIKYNFIPTIDDKDFYCIGLYLNPNLFVTLQDNIENYAFDQYYQLTDNIILLIKSDLIMIVANNENYLSFANFKDTLYATKLNENYNDIDENIRKYIDALYSLVFSKIDPEIIFFGGSLKWNVTTGPMGSTEIEYYNDNNTQEYIIRYDGKIKPTFVDKNTKYYKDAIGENFNNKNSYSSYINTEFEPLYPSLGYFAIKKLSKDNWKYNELPKVEVSAFKNNINILNTPEYSWFETNKNLILLSNFNYSAVNKKIDGKYKTSTEIAKEYIKTLYDIKDDDIVNYIFDKYTITNKWDYFSDTNVDDYIYNLTFILK